MCFALLLLGTSCSIPQTVSSISIETNVEHEEGELKRGDSFELKVTAIDEDIIESVIVDILALEVHDIYDDIEKKKWETTQTYMLTEEVLSGTTEILVIIKDKKGEEKMETSSLTIR